MARHFVAYSAKNSSPPCAACLHTTLITIVFALFGSLPNKAQAALPSAELPNYSVSTETNVVFAEFGEEKLLCDVYLPELPSPPIATVAPQAPPSQTEARTTEGAGTIAPPAPSQNRPAVVVVHGGAWRSGDKLAISPYAIALAKSGIVAISINYRLAPKYQFPSQVDDLRLALLWIADNADKYQIDLERIGLFGYSAGAHLSCLVGTLADASWSTLSQTTAWAEEDPRWMRIPKIRAVVGGGTPTDFRGLPPRTEIFTYFLGGTPSQCPDTYVAASPTFHASKGDPPTLLIHGTRDLLVPLKSSELLRDALLAAGVACELVTLEGPGHMLTFLHPETKRASVQFLCERLGLTELRSQQSSD